MSEVTLGAFIAAASFLAGFISGILLLLRAVRLGRVHHGEN